MSQVLLVEDEQWIADCYRLWLEGDGHAVQHSRDAQEAIDSIDAVRPDVIILDLFLPLANGIQLLQTVRSYTDLRSIPVILCSSSLPEHMPDMRPYGVYRQLHKADLAPGMLQQVVREAVANAAV